MGEGLSKCFWLETQSRFLRQVASMVPNPHALACIS